MCFYKDTQALLAKKTIRQFFINRVAEHTDQGAKVENRKAPLPQREEHIAGESPYKKIQIGNHFIIPFSKSLFSDGSI